MAFLPLRMLNLRIHSMFQLPFCSILISSQKCIKLVTKSYFSAQGRKGAQSFYSSGFTKRYIIEGFAYAVIRGESVRYQFQKHVKQPVVRKTFDGHQKNILILQSEMSNINHEKTDRKPEKKFQQKKDPAKEHAEMQSSEFQRWVLKVEAVLRQKEETVKLQHQLQQYHTRWSEYDTKIKSEEMWQKQVIPLQMSLAAAKKNLADAFPIRHDYESESAISTASRTPQTTPPRQLHSSDAGLASYSGGTQNAVGHLVKEFEQHAQVFEDDARFLVEVKPRQ